MKFLGNVLWFILGGAEEALVWCALGLVFCVTIVGVPVGLQCFKIAGLVVFPFDKTVRYHFKGISLLGNLLWLLFIGWETAIINVILGIFFCCTVIGVPFGLQYLKIAKLTLTPFGADVY